MHFNPGINPNEIGDFDVVEKDGQLHVFYLIWRGKTYLFHWNRGSRDWGAHAGRGFCTLANPKTVRAEADGSLFVESFDWSPLHAGPTKGVTPKIPAAPSCGKWRWAGEHLIGSSEFGTGNWLTRAEHEDFEICADVQLEASRGACEFGLLFRADATGDEAIYARCVPGRYCVELMKQIHNRLQGPESRWRGRSVLQSYHFTPSPDGRYKLRLIAFGPNIEFNVNGRLAISELTLPRRKGRLGVFVEDGEGAWSNISVTPLREPRTNWDW